MKYPHVLTYPKFGPLDFKACKEKIINITSLQCGETYKSISAFKNHLFPTKTQDGAVRMPIL